MRATHDNSAGPQHAPVGDLPSVDPAQLCDVMRSWVTGVAVVTTRSRDGRVAGLTLNSFSSVSLTPPLVLWCLSRASTSLDTYTSADVFAIHIPTASQQELCSRFAQRGGDKFADLEVTEGISGVPLLPGVSACLECVTWAIYDGGDHLIVVGRVVELRSIPVEPLVMAYDKIIPVFGYLPSSGIRPR